MIVTPALLSPAPGATLLAIAGGMGNPAVSVGGAEAAGAGSVNGDVASFSTLLAGATPPSLAATGSTPPTTGNGLPPTGLARSTALALPFAALAITATGPAVAAENARDDDSRPDDLAASDSPAAAFAQTAIPALLILPALAPNAAPQKPVEAIRAEHGTIADVAVASAMAPLATDAVRNAITAPLVRLADDAPLPPVAATMQVALPAMAAFAGTTGARPTASAQPGLRGRTIALAEAADPSDRPDIAPPELAQAEPALAPAAPIAQFIPAVTPAPGDPLVPASPLAAIPADRTDFATLVDTIARAREHAAPQDAAAPVSVSLAHADFGPVALRFRHDGDALAVTMASADPGFATSVSAASAADASAAAGQRQPQSSAGSTSQGSAQTNSGQAGQGEAGQGQADQGQADQRQASQNRLLPRAALRAASRGNPDPDIFA